MSHPDNRIPSFNAGGHNCIKTPTGNHYSKHVQPSNDFEQSDRVTLRNNGDKDTRPTVYQPSGDPSLEGISSDVYECSNTATPAAQCGGSLDLSSDRNACSSPVQSPVTSTSVTSENIAFPPGTCNGSKAVNKTVVPVSQPSDRSCYNKPVKLTVKSNGAPCGNMENYAVAQSSEPQRPVDFPCDKSGYSTTVQSTAESSSAPRENMVFPRETCNGSKVVNYAVAQATQPGRPAHLPCGTSGCNTPLQSTVESNSAPIQNMVFAQETCNGSKVVNYAVAQASQPGRPVDLPCGSSGRNTPLQSTVESNSAPIQNMVVMQETCNGSKVVNYAVAQASQPGRQVDLPCGTSGCNTPLQSTVKSNSTPIQNMVVAQETCNGSKVMNYAVAQAPQPRRPVDLPCGTSGRNPPLRSTVESNSAPSQNMVFLQETCHGSKVVNYAVAQASQPGRPVDLPCGTSGCNTPLLTVESNSAPSQNMVFPQETCKGSKVVDYAVAQASQPGRPFDLPCGTSGCNTPLQSTVESNSAPSQNMVFPQETCKGSKVVDYAVTQASKPRRPVDLLCGTSGCNTSLLSTVESNSAPSQNMVFAQETCIASKVVNYAVAQASQCKRPDVDLSFDKSAFTKPVQSTVQSNSAPSQNMVFSRETCNENKVVNYTVAPVSRRSDGAGHYKPVQSTATSNVSYSQSMVFPQETFNRKKVVNCTVAPVSQPPDRSGHYKPVQSTVTSNTASSQNMVFPQETFNRNKVVYYTVAPVSQPQRPVDLPLDRSGFNKPVQSTVTKTIAPSQNMVSPRETFSRNKVVSNTVSQISKPLRPVGLPADRRGFNTVQSIVASPSAPSKIMLFPQGTFHSGKVESYTVAPPLKPVRPVNLPSDTSGYNNLVQSTVKVEGAIPSSAGILINGNLQGDKHVNQQLLNVNKVNPAASVMFVNKPLPTRTVSCSPLVSEIPNFTVNQPSTVAVKQNYVQPGTYCISSATRLSAGSLVSGINSSTSESSVYSESNPYFQQPSANENTNRRPTDSLSSGTQIPFNSSYFQTADKPYKCPKCSLSFSTEELYNRHIPVHYKKCPHCSEEFRSLKAPYRDLLQHVVLFHKDKDPCNLAHKSTVLSALRGM